MRLRYVTLVAASIATFTCAPVDTSNRAAELAAAVQAEQVEHFVRTFSIAAPALAVERARSLAQTTGVDAAIARGGLDFEADQSVRAVVEQVFQARGYAPMFVAGTVLSADGQAVADAVLGARAHGIDVVSPHEALLRERLAALEAAGDTSALIGDLELDVDDEQRVLAFVKDNVAIDGTLPAHEAVFEILAQPRADNPVPAFAQAIATLAERLTAVAESAPALELTLAACYAHHAAALRYRNLHSVTDEEAATNGWRLQDASRHAEIVAARVASSFQRAQTSGFAAELAVLAPQFEQYPRLVAGLARYNELRAAGGWGTVSVSGTIRPGQRSAAIPAIRQRLNAEGYFQGDLASTEHDAALEAAVEQYQATHQLYENGDITAELISSLNVPVERRIAQIEVALQKWRETRVAADEGGEFIYVNVPDFYGELWDAGELVRRWRVVVGRDQNRRDADGNARGQTPLFSDRLRFLVFNPYWNVPDTVRREDYDPKIAEDPTWLETNGFEIMNEGGREWLRQRPGPGNALGEVKFMFPNQYDVYMHDTPHKHLFGRPTRAYSLGCVRVHEPMELAELLLERDRDWSRGAARSFIERQQERDGEQWIGLNRPIPIHMEYISVRGGDDGQMHFLADPYRLDRPLVDARQAALFPATAD